MKRKLCSVLLALCMVLTLLPVSAMAEDGAVSDGDALKKLFSDVKAGEASSGNVTVTLDKDYNLTDYSWTSLKVDGYHGAGIVTIEGNNHAITGLNAPLFAGGFAGTSGIVIKNLTLTGVKINDTTSNQGIGAFINDVDSMPKIELDNCHLTDSKITSTGGARVGGLIGWTSGYNKENDGPVDTYITVKNCSVENTEITANGSVGGIIGHAGCNPATFHTFNSNAVSNCTLNSTDDGGWRVGVVVGTANVGEISIANTIESNNTLTQTGKTFPDGQSNLYGRFVPNTTGKLVIDGVPVFNSDIIAAIGSTGYKTLADAVTAADNTTVTLLKDTTENVTIPAGATVTLDLNGHKLTNTSGHTITNNGNLTVTGSGTVDNVTHAKAALYNNTGATATLNGGTFTRSAETGTANPNSANGNSWYTVKNYGTLTINNGVTVENKGSFSSAVVNGWYDASKIGTSSEPVHNADAVLTINGGSISGGKITVKNDDYGVLKITGGTFTQPLDGLYCIYNANVTAISGGTVNGPVGSYNGVSTEADQGKLTITGGTYTDDPTDYVASTAIARKDGDAQYTVVAKSNLTAGVYTSDPSSALAPGYVSYKNSDNSTYTVYYPVPVTPGNTSSSTTKNPDGSTTTTTTDKTTGTVTETTVEAVLKARDLSLIHI